MVFITFKDYINDVLKNGSLYIALALVAIILFTITFLLVWNRKKK